MEKEDIGLMIAKSGLNVIPFVGGAIASILGDYQSSRKEKRLNEFINSFFIELQERNSLIVKEYISTEDFLDIFENILSDIMKMRQAEKRQLLKNLLIKSITTDKTSYETTEEFQHLINVLSLKELYILKAFYECKHIPSDTDKNHVLEVLNTAKLKVCINKTENILDFINELESRNLVYHFVLNYYSLDSGVPLISQNPYITEKGRAFYNYITL